MKRTQEELLEVLKKVLGDRTDDDALGLIEDVKDSTGSEPGEDWKAKYEELDKTWREKYKARFFESTKDPKTKPEEKPEDEKEIETSGIALGDLFEGGKIDG